MVIQKRKVPRLGWVLHAEVDPRVGAGSLPPAFAGGVCRISATQSLWASDSTGCSFSCSLVYACEYICQTFILIADKKPHYPGQPFSLCGFVLPLPLPRGGRGGSCGQGYPSACPQALSAFCGGKAVSPVSKAVLSLSLLPSVRACNRILCAHRAHWVSTELSKGAPVLPIMVPQVRRIPSQLYVP